MASDQCLFQVTNILQILWFWTHYCFGCFVRLLQKAVINVGFKTFGINIKLTTYFNEFFKYESGNLSCNISQWKKKANLLLVQKDFFLSFKHLKNSKQIRKQMLINIW